MTYYVIAKNSEDATWHMTLLPAFDISESKLNNFAGLTRDLLIGTGPIQVRGVTEADFTGALGELVPALKIERTKTLQEVHEILIEILMGLHGKFRNPEFTGSGYSPHVTGATLDSEIPEFDAVAITKQDIEGFEEVSSISLKPLT